MSSVGSPGAPRLASLAGKSFAGSFATQLIGATAGVLSARVLGPEGKGLLVVIVLWPGILAALGGGLGLEDAIAYFTARTPERSGAILSTATMLAGGQAMLLTGLGWLVLPRLLPSVDVSVIQDARLYLTWIGLSYFTLTAMATLQGNLRFTALNLLRPVVVFGTLVGLAMLYLGQLVSVHAVVIVNLAANVLALLVAWCLVLRNVRPGPPDARLLRPLLGFAMKAQLGQIAAVANERLDLAVLSMMLASSQLGLYAAALSLSTIVRMFGSTFALVALPALARGRDQTSSSRDLGRLLRATVCTSLLAALAVVIAAPVAVNVLFGTAFAAMVFPAQIVAVATIVLNTCRVLGAGLKAAGLPAQSSVGDVVGAMATLGLLLVLTPRLGLTGAAIAALASYLATLLYLIWIAHRHLEMLPRTLLLPTRADFSWLRRLFLSGVGRPDSIAAEQLSQ